VWLVIGDFRKLPVTSINPPTIAFIYREVLTESFTEAAATTADDPPTRFWIEPAFSSAIPTKVPDEFAALIASPELRGALRSDAARILLRLCRDIPLPRGPFVAAVARAARRRRDRVDPHDP
jgi:hypothetical protein